MSLVRVCVCLVLLVLIMHAMADQLDDCVQVCVDTYNQLRPQRAAVFYYYACVERCLCINRL